MDKREFKDKVYGELAKVTKAMANPHRMEILDLLAQGPFTVEKIANYTGMGIANASQHLQVLKTSRLVEVARKGTFIHYSLANEKVFKAWRAIRDLGIGHSAEVARLISDYRKGQHALQPITAEELLAKIESGEVVVIDVRPGEEYERGHIHRAISIPIEELAERVKGIAKNKEVIAYCRGPLCVYADQAVEILQKKGYQANRLEEGYPDWETLGLPVEKQSL